MAVKKGALAIVFSALLTSLPCFAEHGTTPNKIRVLTSEYYPFNYLEKDSNQLKGFAVEIMQQLLQDLNRSEELEYTSWSTAYLLLNRKQPAAYVSLVRSPSREDKYQWLGPIITEQFYFYRQQHANKSPTNTVGAVRGFAGGEYLKQQGKYQVRLYPSEKMLFQTFAKDIHQLIFQTDIAICTKLILHGLSHIKVEPVEKSYQVETYIAFNHSVAPSTVQQFRSSLERLRASGQLDTIIAEHLHEKDSCLANTQRLP